MNGFRNNDALCAGSERIPTVEEQGSTGKARIIDVSHSRASSLLKNSGGQIAERFFRRCVSQLRDVSGVIR